MTRQLNIEVISAGAGSGKTYTLTGKMVEMLQKGVRPGGIMATTFTQKAAAELQERVRKRLLEAGMTEAANELGSALIGTVHSIGTRMLQRFAFEAGVSPLVEIIAENDGQRLFNESLSQVLTEARIETMNRLADRLGLTKKTMGDPYDWRRVIRELTDVARANNFSREVLETSKLRSWQSFENLLPPVQTTDALTWHNRLLSQMEQTAAALDAQETDTTKTTREAAETLRALQNQLKWREELYWHEWVKIAKTNVGAKSRDLFQPLKDFALTHDEHRQFREDIKAFIDNVFDISMDALGEFEQYKKKRGLIDYTDMETYVSRLLRVESVRQTLARELDLLLVDEFQDTSPIQLDIFLQLSQLAKHSIWVGDPKQSIYGFRGAEPALMKAIIDATGGIKDENILKTSWRSRPDLVYLVNAIFTKAFRDLPEAQVALAPPPDPSPRGEGSLPSNLLKDIKNFGEEDGNDLHNSNTEKQASEDKKNSSSSDARASEMPNPTLNQAPLPPGGGVGGGAIHWHFRNELDERKTPGSPWLENCIANQIRILLDRQIPVFSKKRDSSRPIRPGDIAVLCRSNRACLEIAEALHRAGLKAAIARAGLLETPEAKLTLACLKFLVTPSDALSAVEILLLTGSNTLEELIEARLNPQHESGLLHGTIHGSFPNGGAGGGRRREGLDGEGFIAKLFELRPRTADLSASEILNLLLDELEIRRIAVRFGNPAQRLDNLDRLRRYAIDYESACNRLHSAASLGGFLLWINHLADTEQDAQGSGESPEAVKVLTYHRSKGLEFPVTICHNLDQQLKEQVWGINLVAEGEPDLDNILGKRWLRFWVNPYADQLKGTRLEERLLQSDEWTQATRTALEEEARLLYVGLTRARDYLVFPTTPKGTRWLNRVFNHGDESIQTLDPDSDETPFYWKGQVIYCENEPLYKPRDFPEALPDEAPISFHAERAGRYAPLRQSLLIDPQQEPPGLRYKLGEPIPFAAWLAFKDDFTNELGKAVQSFFLADYQSLPQQDRLAMAVKQLDIRQVRESLNPEALARQSEAFHQFLQSRLVPQTMQAFYPIEGRHRKRFIQLEADLFYTNPEEIGVLLFAGFAEGMKKWKVQAQALAPVLGWYELLLKPLYPDKKRSYWLVFPVEGQMVEIGISVAS